MNILEYQSFYLVGIKGVAMASLAQCLVEAGKKAAGCDVAEKFVTQPLLDKLGVSIDEGFTHSLPIDSECVIYTAAHQGQFNPMVQAARQNNIPTFSHAEALAALFNQQAGIAVCGVGGKSTTSAMIAWMLDAVLDHKVSYAVGVGNIPGLDKTGQWRSDAQYFVAEADEYVTDPSAPKRGEEITPRFSFMKPFVTVCTNLKYDHPDVYRDFDHTQSVYQTFFHSLKPGGFLVANGDDQPLTELAKRSLNSDAQLITFGENVGNTVRLTNYASREGKTTATLIIKDQEFTLTLLLPGKYNVMNAVAALSVCSALGLDLQKCVEALATFRSTLRRAEYIGEKNGVKYYDDYAHHPNEIRSVIAAFKEWYPGHDVVVAFQSHTFSRTKALFDEFVKAFAMADEVVMIDIFASAREPFDESITSDMLCEAIQNNYSHIPAHNEKTLENLADFLKRNLRPGEICLTIGAGDIYKVHELIK